MSRGHSRRIQEKQLKHASQRRKRKRRSGAAYRPPPTVSADRLEEHARRLREEDSA
jgi:hypothetical protein